MADLVTPSIRLIGIDVDGTLVGASGEVQPRVWDAASRAREAGIHLALCSGRAAFGVALEYARRLDPEGWHVFQNGASIVHLGTERSLSVSIPSTTIAGLIDVARRTNRILELYSDRDYVTESASTWAREHAELLGVPFEPRPFEALKDPVVRAQWVVSPQESQVVMAEAPAGVEVAESTSPIMPDARFVGLTHEGVSKGSAMRAIAHEYGIPLEHVMYVGDAGNDMSALRVAGMPVAMGNADAMVRAAAKLTVGDVEDGGLIDALEHAIQSSRG